MYNTPDVGVNQSRNTIDSARDPEPPIAPDAEKAALCSILLDQKLPKEYSIDRSIFLTPTHREIFCAMEALDRAGERIDPAQVSEYLRRHGLDEKCGGHYYITTLYDYGIRSGLEGAIRTLNETLNKRRIWALTHKYQQLSMNGVASREILEAMRNDIDEIESAPGAAPRWPVVRPLPGGRLRAPELDEMIVPEPFRAWIKDIAFQLQTPIEYPAIPALISLATVLGSKIRIKPKRRSDWVVCANLWGSVIGDPGTLKSPAIAQATKPLRRLVAAAEEDYELRKKNYNIDKEIDEDRRKDALKRLKAAVTANEDPASIEALRKDVGEPLDAPTEKRYIVVDATIEVVGQKLAENDNGLLLFRDELIGWLNGLDRESNTDARSFYLEAWDGGGFYDFERIGRGRTKIKNNTMSVVGGIQPGPLVAYVEAASQNGGGADGLFQRFQLMVWPEEPPNFQYVDDWPDNEAKNRAFKIFKWVDDLTPSRCEEEHGYGFLRFDDEAQAVFAKWSTELNRRIRSGNYEPAFKSMLAKYGSLFASLALLFHLSNIAGTDAERLPPISLEATNLALQWCDWLEAHARKVYGLREAEADESVKALALKLKERKVSETFQVRDIRRKEWSRLTDNEIVTNACDILADLGWLIKKEQESAVRGGKAKIFYTVNPNVENV